MQDSRIDEIQNKVNAEKATILKLQAAVKSNDLKMMLTSALNTTTDVEMVFLDSAHREKRTPGALATWLGWAELVLSHAVNKRKQVDEIVSKYGLDAEML